LNSQTAAEISPSKQPKAIIIGGSIGGMLTAAAIAPYFGSVTILERDEIDEDSNSARRGAPQGAHLHFLLKGGEKIVERLLPGVVEDLRRGGAKPFDFGTDISWFMYGDWKKCESVGYEMSQQSRPFLENVVRNRLKKISNVEYVSGIRVLSMMTNDDKSAVTGVVTRRKGDETETSHAADLVVDSSGKHAKSPAWLESWGYEKPEEDMVSIDLAYTSQELKLPNGEERVGRGGVVLLLSPPHSTTGGGIFPLEGKDRYMMTLFGYFGNHPPTDPEGFGKFAQSLQQPDLYDILQDAEPVGGCTAFKYPGSVRRFYERLSRFPKGLLVIGDSRCSISPIYGQGMSKAAMEAEALANLLSDISTEDKWHEKPFWRDYYSSTAKIIDVAWEMSTAEDLQYPDTVGKRPWYLPLMTWYNRRLMSMASRDPSVLAKFFRVTNFVDDQKILFTPKMIFGALRRR